MKRLFCCLLAAVFSLSATACAAPREQAAVEPTLQILAVETDVPESTGTPEATETAEAAGTDAIEFNDDVLESLVRESMKKPTGDITVADAEAVTDLEMQMQGVDPDQPYIHDLSALRYFTNLTYLGLGYAVLNADDPTAPIDISPLAGMSKLESLQLGGLVIDDLSIVANMPNLKSLTVFGGGKLSDLLPLSGLTRLQALTLRGNAISDITPLSALTNLLYLDLQANQVTDVSALSRLTNLQRLFLANNPVSDFSPLQEIRAGLLEWDFDVPQEP
ncbi:MAG: leucine-rich repeat domain-containing protein [Eubacteriales bacterium]|nr:leucine-rich repeat domain-containing protein [Eubacteriales bacterium]